MLDIRANVERVRQAIARACGRAGRSPDDVLLVAVSKTVEAERIRLALAAGIAALGENRVQEAREKIEALGRPVPWHLIGALQTNKAKDAARLFDWIHSVDRVELARELSRRAHALDRTLDILIQVNLGEEPQKAGVAPAELKALVAESDVVILAVKPQIMASVLHEIAGSVSGKLLISIAAGIPTRTLRAQLGRPARLIRVMPNTPALVLEGVTAIARAEGLEAGDLETAQELFGAVGRVVVLEEDALDAVTGLSGSGPAYVAIVIESLADGGVKMGLDRATAMTLAAQTVLGSAKLILETGTHPGQLKDMVSSPGGTTIAGIAALEEGGVRRTFISAVERATQRSRELGRG